MKKTNLKQKLTKIGTKIKRFIKYLIHNIRCVVVLILINPINKLKVIHQLLLQINTENIKILDVEQNSYHVFFSWLLEIVQYGTFIVIPYNTFLGWQGWLNLALIPSFGIIRWFIL